MGWGYGYVMGQGIEVARGGCARILSDVTFRVANALVYLRTIPDISGTHMHRMLLYGLVMATAALPGGRAVADASLFVYPTLVMFDGNLSSAEVTIANRGDESSTFEIGWANMSMTPEGGLIRQEEEVPWSIQPFLRYSPRRVTLGPFESQVVKIALRRDDTVPEGEYYSHMRVVTINSAAPDGEDGGDPEVEAEPGVSIQARSAIAIPVVWRNSRATPAASIESVEIDAESNAINAAVARPGLLSARGFLHVVDGGELGATKALAEPMPLILYPTVDRRTVSIPLLAAYAADSLPADAAVVFSADETLTEQSLVYSNRRIVAER